MFSMQGIQAASLLLKEEVTDIFDKWFVLAKTQTLQLQMSVFTSIRKHYEKGFFRRRSSGNVQVNKRLGGTRERQSMDLKNFRVALGSQTFTWKAKN